MNEKFETVKDALKLFENDDLLSEPGKEFNYTTHGFTLVSAVLEKAAGKTFPKLLKSLCHDLGLQNTQLDVNKTIIDDRASYYVRSKKVLENCQEVDNSYKWAGGGILSNVRDLLVFGNAMLFSSQSDSSNTYLKRKTLNDFWKGEIDASVNIRAALGWMRIDKVNVDGIKEKALPTIWYHTGGAVGSSSVLLISPTCMEVKGKENPDGICIVMLCNLQDTPLLPLAREIESLIRSH
ncbi:unnamed protein product [Auanema sp. JU1783]|nr:unnamed protein product [Auanema sp. JU1783]